MYISGTGAISPQKTFSRVFPFQIEANETLALACQEPEYKEYISPRISRRMSRVVKMGTTASLIALKEAGLENVDAVITGTGLGCMTDTEVFLGAITENEESFLNPAPFIHSTHNTISSQIALLLKCTGYNQTFVHGATSFEAALLDSFLMGQESSCHSILVGGVDEMTPNLFAILKRLGRWKRKAIANHNLISAPSKGTIAGEGSAYFVLTSKPQKQAYAKVAAIEISPVSEDESTLKQYIENILAQHNLSTDSIDLCLLGKNGDIQHDHQYKFLEEKVFNQCTIAAFKHLCGEYPTASSFAFWLAANIIKHKQVPDFVIIKQREIRELNSVLIVNRFHDNRISLVLLNSCDF